MRRPRERRRQDAHEEDVGEDHRAHRRRQLSPLARHLEAARPARRARSRPPSSGWSIAAPRTATAATDGEERRLALPLAHERRAESLEHVPRAAPARERRARPPRCVPRPRRAPPRRRAPWSGSGSTRCRGSLPPQRAISSTRASARPSRRMTSRATSRMRLRVSSRWRSRSVSPSPTCPDGTAAMGILREGSFTDTRH